MADFTATSRIPTRPLSYANVSMAYRKELVVDYTDGMVYIVDENGDVHNVAEQVYQQLILNGDITDNITIQIPDGSGGTTNVTVEAALTQVINDIDTIQSNITEINKIIEELSNEDGSISINASNVVQDATHRFLTDTQIASLQEKVTIKEVTVTINPADVSGSAAPYACTKAVAGVSPDYPAPTIDINFTDDVFANNEKEEDAYYCMYRCKITTANEATFYFKTKPETAFQVRFQIKVPGI